MSCNDLIFADLTIVLQRIQDAVRTGYPIYFPGRIPIEHLEQTLAWFDLDLHVFDDKNARARRKRRGLGNATIVLWWDKSDPGHVQYLLLVCARDAGHHPIHSLYKLRDALTAGERVEITGLELVRMPRAGTCLSKLTWRMTAATEQSWRDTIIAAVRSRSYSSIRRMLFELWTSAYGFNGARRQVGVLTKLYRAEVKRASLKNAPLPPRKLPYLRRVPHTGLTVREFLSEHPAPIGPQSSDYPIKTEDGGNE